MFAINGKKYLLSAAAGVLLLAGGTLSAGAQAAPTATATPPAAGAQAGYGAGARWGAQASAPTIVADLLGMTASEIQAERQAGKSLVEIAAAKGVSEDKLVAEIIADRQAQLDARVKAGTLSEEQEQLMLERMQTQVKAAVERTTVGPMGPADGAGLGLGLGPRNQQAQNQNGTLRQGPGPRAGGYGLRLHR